MPGATGGWGCSTERADGGIGYAVRDTDKLTTCPVVRRVVAAAVVPAARWCVPGPVQYSQRNRGTRRAEKGGQSCQEVSGSSLPPRSRSESKRKGTV